MDNQSSNSQALLNLVSDEKFEEIESLASKPNLFKIVGRTHTETWHSMFLGWLLDPKGSHGLGEFTLKRLLYSCTKPTIKGKNAEFDKIATFASLGRLNKAQVYPSESEQVEYQCEAGRLDVFVEFDESDFEGEKVIILIEQKVGAKIDKSQCEKYINWLKEQHPNCFVIPIFLSPSDQLQGSSEITFGTPDWYGIDYQMLHDIVLVPALNNTKLNPDAHYLIDQYINNLRIPMKGTKLAITEEEKELAYSIYEKHKHAFDIIEAVLADELDHKNPQQTDSVELRVKINGTEIFGNSVKEYYLEVLKFLVDSDINLNQVTPFETSPRRYFLATNSQHQRGNEFRAPINYGGYFLETHKNRAQAQRDMLKFLSQLDIELTE